MIVFVVAHHINHFREGFTAPLEEVVITLALSELCVSICCLEVMCHTDIAAEDQHIGTLCVHKVDVAKLKMQIGCYRYLHFLIF